MKKLIMLLAISACTLSQAQMTATFDLTVNSLCNGDDCEYSGPSILINEIMVSPSVGDGSISGNDATRKGEWIELYNPNLCEPVDISCYFLGSSAPQTLGTTGEGFQLPGGTVVPAGGFCVVRGVNATPVNSSLLVVNGGNTIEVIVPGSLSGDGICVDGLSPTRLWFPNAGGWFAFYDASGVAQDAISWGSQAGIGISPCIPSHSSCTGSSVSSLASYNDIPANRKVKLYNGAVPDSWGNSIQRSTDGGTWAINTGSSPTEGDCNGICIPTFSSTCDGTATVNVSGGSGNYSYVWDDSQGSLTQTATGLCDGTYNVVVTDIDNGGSQTFQIVIQDSIPPVSLTINEELCNYGQTVSMDDISTYSPHPGAGETGEFVGTGASGTDFDVSVSGEGTFPIIYTFTNEHGCQNATSATNLIVHELPQPEITDISTDYCSADSIVIPTLNPTGGILTGPGITNGEFSVEDAGVGTHIIEYAVENQYGCKDTATVTVNVHELPTFTLDNTQPNCSQSDGVIIITPNTGDFPFIYSIDDGNNSQSDSTFSNLSAGAYQLMVTDDNGCIGTMDTTLNSPNSKDPSFNFSDFCEGESNGATAIASTDGSFTFFPTVSDGATIDPVTGVISDGIAGTTYTVQHITTGICPDTAAIDVTVFSVPNMDVEADPIEGMPPLLVEFTNNSTGADSYAWEFGDGSNEQNDDITVPHNFLNEGVFMTYVIGETNNGMCVDTAEIEIIAIYPILSYEFPNIFTPNGDNANDFFKLIHYENIKSINIVILNRWGNVLFESNEPAFAWDGKRNNSNTDCTDGTYFYKATLENYAGEEVQEHGFIQLSRE